METHVVRHEHAQLRRNAPRCPTRVRAQRRSNFLPDLTFGPLHPSVMSVPTSLRVHDDVFARCALQLCRGDAAKAACFRHGHEQPHEPGGPLLGQQRSSGSRWCRSRRFARSLSLWASMVRQLLGMVLFQAVLGL